jgi:small-conductance mechanosensitive channel
MSATVINACLVLLGGLIAWKLIAVITDKVLVSGTDGNNDSQKLSEEPGASGGTRLETVLPLVSRIAQFATAALTFLIVLSVLGVDTAPLLAGAGIVGLAVGFGAQKLVQDIVSGIFFLIDDAFRVGEYLDVGGTMGTVEKISIRSFQLRHHLGAIQTLPFGNISQISNFSRDWSIMKLNLRLTYGTDANKVRKMIKNLGQELLDHPDIGDKFLEPLKSQGVSAMEDSAMIMRVKFRTKPGDQFIVRRFVLDEIHKLFEANDIRFANREVTVHVANHHPESLTNSVIGTASGAAGALLQNDSQTSPTTASPKTDQ